MKQSFAGVHIVHSKVTAQLQNIEHIYEKMARTKASVKSAEKELQNYIKRNPALFRRKLVKNKTRDEHVRERLIFENRPKISKSCQTSAPKHKNVGTQTGQEEKELIDTFLSSEEVSQILER